jgi:hypothetical protein
MSLKTNLAETSLLPSRPDGLSIPPCRLHRGQAMVPAKMPACLAVIRRSKVWPQPRFWHATR